MKKINGVEHLGAPLYVLDPEDDNFDVNKLTDPSCYVIAGNGMFTVDKTDHHITVRRTTGCGMETVDMKEGVAWAGAPMDGITASFLDSFFRSVYNKLGTEAVVLLYQDSKGAWYVRVPEQEVASASAKWKDGVSVWYKQGEQLNSIPNDLTAVGSAHSHGSMDAFFSGGDDTDDRMTCGLHLVFGGYGKKALVARVTSGGQKSDLDTASVLPMTGGVRTDLPVPEIIRKQSFTAYSSNTGQIGTWGAKTSPLPWDKTQENKKQHALLPDKNYLRGVGKVTQPKSKEDPWPVDDAAWGFDVTDDDDDYYDLYPSDGTEPLPDITYLNDLKPADMSPADLQKEIDKLETIVGVIEEQEMTCNSYLDVLYQQLERPSYGVAQK